MNNFAAAVLTTILLFVSVNIWAEKKEDLGCISRIKLDYPDKDVRVVLFAYSLEDPLESYKKNLVKMKKFLLSRSTERDKEVEIVSAWDRIFANMSPFELWYLENSNSTEERVFDDKYSCYNKRRWVVTMARSFNDKTLCWGVPFVGKKGKTIKVNLTKDNVIDYKKLEKIYDSIVK